MAEIIDTLYGFLTAAPPGPRNTFTFTTAARKATIDVTHAADWTWTLGIKVGAAHGQRFAVRDNFRILSYGLKLPHGAMLADEGGLIEPCTIRLKGNSSLVADYFFDEVSYLAVPFANYEIATDILVPWSNSPATATWLTIEAHMESGEVSMVGLNAALNGIVGYPTPFVKVLHTVPLTVV